MTLNELTIKNLRLPEGKAQIDVWCSQLPRFGVRIGTRRKSYIVHIGNTRKVIGLYPAMSVKDARDAAKRLLWANYLPKSSPSAPSLVEEYLKAFSADHRPATIKTYTIYLKLIPNNPISDLTPKLLYDALPKKKAAANMAFSIFKAFLSWCRERGHIDHNPLTHRKQPNKLKSRDRLLTDEEVKAIWIESYNHNSFGVLTRILVSSGQRLNQITNLQHNWLQSSPPTTIVFPSYIMKGDVEHTLPLTSFSLQELRQLPSLYSKVPPHPCAQNQIYPSSNSTTYLWGDKPFPRGSLSTSMREFRAALPHIPHWTLHDTRRFMSSTMAKLGIKQEVVERILAHRTGKVSGVAAIYNRHDYQEEMRLALTEYHNYLLAIGCHNR